MKVHSDSDNSMLAKGGVTLQKGVWNCELFRFVKCVRVI